MLCPVSLPVSLRGCLSRSAVWLWAIHVTRSLDSPPVVRISTRATRSAAWSPLIDLGVNGHGLTMDAEGRYGVLHRNTLANENQLLRVSRPTPNAQWEAPATIDELNTALDESNAFLDASGLQVYFESNPDGNANLYVATRATRDASFGAAAALTELNTPALESDPWLSTDGRTIVFVSDRGGQLEFYSARR